MSIYALEPEWDDDIEFVREPCFSLSLGHIIGDYEVTLTIAANFPCDLDWLASAD